MNPIKPIIKVKTNEELDTEKGESTKVHDRILTYGTLLDVLW